MKSLTTKLGVVGIVLISCATLRAQNFTVQSGNWNSTATWSLGIVPDASSGSITVNHKVDISTGTVLTVDELTLNDTLRIESGSTLILNNAKGAVADLQVLTGGLKVRGKLICRDSATFSGTTSTNTFFYDGSTYEHQYFNTAGAPPTAFWSINSNLEITGYTRGKSLNSALWSQSLGNVIYNCAGQASFVSLGGRIKTIKGNLIILNTGGQILRLSEDQTTPTTMTIGGNFIIDGRSVVWFSRTATISIFVAQDFKLLSTATSSCYLTTTGNCQVNVEGNFEMNTSSLLRFASGTESGVGTLRVKRNFLFTLGTIRVSEGTGIGTLEMNGSSPQSFSSLGLWTSGVNLLINNTAGVNVQDNSKVEGNVTVSPIGKLILPKANVILHGDLTVQRGGSLKSNQGTLTLAGSNNQSVALKGDTLHNINIDKTQGTSITFSDAVRLSGSLSILSTNTTVHANENLTLLSSSDNGYSDASISILPMGSSVLGNVTVQRFMSGEGRIYRYISSPVNNASIDSLMDDFPITGAFNDPSTGPGIRSYSPSFFYYDESLAEPLGWTAYPTSGFASENLLEVGRGYSAFIREASKATTWDVTGVVNQGDIDLPVTFTDTGSPTKDGWNLVGNPYPSAINWNVADGWNKVHINNGIAVRDNGIGDFLYWDGDVGSLGSGRIAKGQSFWIKTNDLSPQLKIKETAKSSISTAFYRKKFSEPDYIEVSIQSNERNDRTYLRIRDYAREGYDSLDVVKFSNDFMSFSFETGKTQLAISAVDHLDCSQRYALSLSFTKNSDGSFIQSPIGHYQLSANSFGVFVGNDIFIHDAFLNLDFNLTSSTYSFSITTDPASYASDRFSLVFVSPILNESIFIAADSILCDSSAYNVVLKNIQENTRYEVLVDNNTIDSYLNQHSDRLAFKLKSNELNDRTTILKIKASNACYSKVINEFTVSRQSTHAPNLTTELACNSETATLRAGNTKDAVAFNWYDHNQNFIAQTRDSSFVVAIQKSTVFYASLVFGHGCTSDTISVVANVVWYDVPSITEDQGMLHTNYISNIQWGLDGQEIVGATQPIFEPALSGNYSLTTIHDGCIDSTFYYFTYQDEFCRVFPNPAENEVHVVAPRDELIVQIGIINASGQSVGVVYGESNIKSKIVSVENLASGVYLLLVSTSKDRYSMQILKK